VEIGEGSIVVAQVGISGSTTVGRGVVLAGQAGIVGHIEIGDGAIVAAQAGVTKSIPPGERVSGYPARKHAAAKRLHAFMEHLPKLVGKVRGLEKRVADLERDARPPREGVVDGRGRQDEEA
jgi:UDP-3-O-[3-hydroxymyristoyl] glucosamine N-acyltransferase